MVKKNFHVTDVLHICEAYLVIIFLLNAINCLVCYILLSWFRLE